MACSHLARTRLSRVEAGRKAGQTKAAQRPQRMTHARQQGYRAGYADGWEACIVAMQQGAE